MADFAQHGDMSPAGKKTVLILFGAMAIVLIIAALSSEDEDQSSAWRGVFRLLNAIGRVL